VSLLFLVKIRWTMWPCTFSYFVSANLASCDHRCWQIINSNRYVRGSAKILLAYKVENGKLHCALLVWITIGRVLLSHRRGRHCEPCHCSSTDRWKMSHDYYYTHIPYYIPTANSVSLQSQHIIPIASKKYLNHTGTYIYIFRYIYIYLNAYIVIGKYFIFFLYNDR